MKNLFLFRFSDGFALGQLILCVCCCAGELLGLQRADFLFIIAHFPAFNLSAGFDPSDSIYSCQRYNRKYCSIVESFLTLGLFQIFCYDFVCLSAMIN